MLAWLKRLAAPVAAVAVFGLFAPTQSRADVVGVGGAIGSPSVIPAGMLPSGFPSVPTQELSGNYSQTNALSVVTGTGSYDIQVYSPDTNNGNLTTIVFTVGVTTGDVNRITLSNFGAYSTDVYVASGAGTNALFVDRLSDGGTTLGFQFNQFPTVDGLNAGDTSATFVIRTNAPSYVPGSLSLIDGGTGNVISFAPVPVPAAVWGGVSLLGLLGGGRLWKRRREVA